MKDKFKFSYKSPDNIHLVADDVYQLAILQYLIQLDSGLSNIHPSMETLRLGLMCHDMVNKAIRSLQAKNLIKVISAGYPLANTYKVNHDEINNQIFRKLSLKELSDKGLKELSEQQKDAISVKRVAKDLKLRIKTANWNNETLVDNSTGEVKNG